MKRLGLQSGVMLGETDGVAILGAVVFKEGRRCQNDELEEAAADAAACFWWWL